MGGAATEIGAGDHRRGAGGRALGAGDDLPRHPPAQAAQRGVQALRARRRPAGRRPGAGRAACALLAEHGGGRRRPRGRRWPARSGAGDHRAGRRPARAHGRHPDPGTRSCSGGWSRSAARSTAAPAGCSRSCRRPGGADLVDPADLVEEVVRLEGYESIPSVLPTPPPGRGLTERQRVRRSIGRALADVGLVEVLTYPFVGAVGLGRRSAWTTTTRGGGRCGWSTRCPRPSRSCAPRCCRACSRALRRNVGRGQRDVALYEAGLVFLPPETLPPLPAVGVSPAADRRGAGRAGGRRSRTSRRHVGGGARRRRSSRPAGGVRGGRRPGPTRSRRPARWPGWRRCR